MLTCRTNLMLNLAYLAPCSRHCRPASEAATAAPIELASSSMTDPSATGLGSLRPRPKPAAASAFLFDPSATSDSDRRDEGHHQYHQQDQPESEPPPLGSRFSGHQGAEGAAGVAEGYMASSSHSPHVTTTSHSNPPSQRSSIAGAGSRMSHTTLLPPGVMWEEGGGATMDGAFMGPASGKRTVFVIQLKSRPLCAGCSACLLVLICQL